MQPGLMIQPDTQLVASHVSYTRIYLDHFPYSRFLHASCCSGRCLDSRLERNVNIFIVLINVHFPSGAIVFRLMTDCRP